MCRLTGEMPAELAQAPELPDGGVVVWRWYVDLAMARRQSGFGATALAWADVDAYFRLRRVTPEPWEIAAIQAVDARFLRALQDRADEAKQRAGRAD